MTREMIVTETGNRFDCTLGGVAVQCEVATLQI